MKNLSYLLSISLLCLFFSSCQKSPDIQENSFDNKQLFDYDWKFTLGDYPAASNPDFNDSLWRSLDLPHDWSIEQAPDPSEASGNDGGYFPTGTAWYRKNFYIPAEWLGKTISLCFEGVYMNSEVFINGHSLGIHPYGYTSFIYELTTYLNYGQNNVISVRVDNATQKNCRWYSGSGIYRHVLLYINNPVHIDPWGVFITSGSISDKKAIVELSTRIKNKSDSAQKIRLSSVLKDKNDRIAGKNNKTILVPANEEIEIIQQIKVKNPQLWSPSSPQLYTAEISLFQKDKQLHKSSNIFGIRSIQYSSEEGFKLNGQSILLNGGCVHHDHGCLGAASYDRAEERKVELLKAAGFNAVRTSHNPFSPAFYEACDRLGLMVIGEAFDGWRTAKTAHDYANYFDEWSQKDLESMVLRDRNHPSIILWSTGNEIIERTEPQAVETAKRLADIVRKLDPTRPVTSALTTWGQGWTIFDPLFAEHDIGGYNYQIHSAESDHERVPSRIMLQTESYPKDAFYCWNMVRQHPYIIGDFVWTAMDYLGESGIGGYYYPGEEAVDHWVNDRYPWHGAYCGDIDLCGRRKPVSHYRSMLWNNTDSLYMAVYEPNPADGAIRLTGWAVRPCRASWTWPGHENKIIDVVVYSKYDKVRLYLNDELMGEKPCGFDQEFKAVFSIPYQQGIIKACGVRGTEEQAVCSLQTAGPAAKIRLIADRIKLKSNGQDLAFISVEITDEQGIVRSDADHCLHFMIEGAGSVAGLGNANLKDSESYQAASRKAFQGYALAVIKSKRQAGPVQLTVSSPGLQTATVSLQCEQ